MADHHCDLLVIGAGASGASVAYEAVRRGLSVVLLDAGDIGGGTSCRSTKLLHGGVRYLELAFKTLDLAQLQLVREALMERAHWLNQAPFLAQRLELALPCESWLSQVYYGVGLSLYDALAGRSGIGRSRWLAEPELRSNLPLLKSAAGGVVYSDGQFDDARLNLLLALTAEQAGATLRTRCRVKALERNSDGELNAAITESPDGKNERWRAQVIVNATGVQADSIRQLANADAAPRLLTSRGTHLVLKQQLCPQGMGLLVPSTEDKRVLFMLPFFGHTLVGTTDSQCPTESATTPDETEQGYLLRYVQQWFPGVETPQVSSCWAGGRPLIRPADDGQDRSHVVREHTVETLPCGLVSLMGGKWTTCRPMALDTLAAVEQRLERSLPPPKPMPLRGSASSATATQRGMVEQAVALKQLLPDGPHQQRQIEHLQQNHGLDALPLIQSTPAAARAPLSDVLPICSGEIDQAIKAEHARSTSDVLARRCRLAMVDLAEARRLEPLVQERLVQSGLPEVSTSPINHQLMP